MIYLIFSSGINNLWKSLIFDRPLFYEIEPEEETPLQIVLRFLGFISQKGLTINGSENDKVIVFRNFPIHTVRYI